MVVTPPIVIDLVADSVASNHTTPDAGNLIIFRPFHLCIPSPIVGGNGFVLPVTLVGARYFLTHFTLTISLLLLTFKISCMFAVLLLTTGVLWNLICLVFL
jgi:hypothetical protein